MSVPDKKYVTSLIEKIMEAEGSEEELDECIQELKQISSMPNVTDLIFYPKNPNATAEEVAAEILAFKPHLFLK